MDLKTWHKLMMMKITIFDDYNSTNTFLRVEDETMSAIIISEQRAQLHSWTRSLHDVVKLCENAHLLMAKKMGNGEKIYVKN